MSKTIKNIITILGIITVVFGGYYLYTEMVADDTDAFTENDQSLEDMLNDTRVFIERGRILDRMELDIALFEDEQFNARQSFSEPINYVQPNNRVNPFLDPSSVTDNEDEVVPSDENN